MTPGRARTPVAACPVCGAPIIAPPLATYSVDRAARHFCPPWRDADRHRRLVASLGALWPEGQVQIQRCSACGFSFGDPFVGGDESFYRILHEQMGYPAWRWDYDVALQQPVVARLGGGRVLDVGAGTGNFLQRLGSRWECHAMESSETTRAALAGRGIPAHAAVDDPPLLALAGTFDLVTMFQVLEHVAEFYPLLHGCRELLKPGGALFITVPSADAMIAQERMTGCPDMPPNHINRWTPESLAHALRLCGFDPGVPIAEPAAFSKLGQNLYLRVLADAARAGSLAARIYRIRQKRFRAPLLRFVAGPWAILRLARHGRQLFNGGAFAMSARRGHAANGAGQPPIPPPPCARP